jgi:hypothetical protein
MAVTYKVTSSISMDAGGLLSMSTLSRVFTVEAFEDGVRKKLIATDFDDLQREGVLPRNGAPIMASWGVNAVVDTLRWRRFQVSEVAGVLTVNAQASTRYVWDYEYPNGEFVGRAWLPIVGAFVARPINVRAYRSWDDATYPADPFAPGTSDIGGTKIDASGQPRETIIDGGELVLSTWIDTLATKKGDAWTDATNNFIGRFNSEPFLGFPKATLLCYEYPTPHEEDEYHQATLRFLYSPVFHFEQIAAMDADSRIITDANGHAKTVRWVRVGTKPAVDFNTIFGAAGAEAEFRKWRAEHGLYPLPP